MKTLTPPQRDGITRRDLFRYGAISAAGIALTPLLSFSYPSKAFGYPYEIKTLSDRDFLDPFPIDIQEELCANGPDNIKINGTEHAYLIQESSVLYGVYLPDAHRDEVNNLEAIANYKKVGITRNEGRLVGCNVTMSNFVLSTDSIISVRNLLFFGCRFNRFDSFRGAQWLWGCESADCDYVFYYSDTLEPLSIKNSVISVTSLDSGYGDYPGVGWNHEGVVLPERVSQVYRSQDCVVAIDQTLSLRNTYAHACFGNSGIANSASSEYDASNVQKHGISWLCPDDSVKFKALTPIGSCGFGLYTQPMTNATPNNPRKSYTIK